MDNKEIAKILFQTADILEIKGSNPFRINAYRQAARSIENLAKDINQIFKKEKLEEIPGVGEGIARFIKDLIEKGFCPEFEKLKKEVPLSVLKLLEIDGLGPKKVKFLYHKFNITSLYKLEKLLKTKKLYNLEGWGKKSIENIIKSINAYKRFNKRFLLGKVHPLVEEIVKKLKESKFVDKIEVCGSVRRWKETVGDVDILITSKKPKQIIKDFTTLKQVKKIKSQGSTKAQIILKQGINVDLRVVQPNNFGAAIHYFTGSKAHNIRIRKLALKKNLRINEYGIFRKKGKKMEKIGGKNEKDIFKAVNLPWIPPEIREDQGEIEAGLKKKLPQLITLKDIKGDCHVHTNWSDGIESISKMVITAKKRGYQYIAITDHASPISVTNGLTIKDKKRISRYLKEIKRVDQKIKGIKVLSGIEVDIKKNGELYLPDNILKKFDLVNAGVHNSLRMDKKKMTQRVCRALNNPYVNVLAHPNNRLINKRELSNLDLEIILKEAKKTKTILEINASWRRLDLNPFQSRLAKQQGVKMIINTDSHHSNSLENMEYGVATARRGWLEKKDVINTLSLKELLNSLKK